MQMRGNSWRSNSQNDGGPPFGHGFAEITHELVEIGSLADLFHDRDRRAWAKVPMGPDRSDCYPTESGEFRTWLAQNYYEKHGCSASAHALKGAVDALTGRAKYASPMLPVYIRTALHDSRLYIDLADENGTIVEVSESGWGIATDPPVRFYRPSLP